VWVHTLRVTDLRRFESAEVVFGPGLNLIVGPNGAGKTTLLEALFLLSYGRSFRRGSRDSLLRLGAERYTVHARLQRDDGSSTRVGLERHGNRWVARADEQDLARLSDLYARCAVCCFEPGSHELIGGGGEGRRAYLDWGVFHVEPGFLPLWRRCQRALEQRGALLRTPAGPAEFAPWHEELGRSAEAVDTLRRHYLALLRPRVEAAAAFLLPELGAATLGYHPGWDDPTPGALAALLERELERDRRRGQTSRGPHRADWQLSFEGAPRREHLSRGQEKLAALACVLAQAELHRDTLGEWPVVALDDLPSELDHAHQDRVLDQLARCGAQVLITGTEASPPLKARIPADTWFHVEPTGIRTSVEQPPEAAG
jgi:DNA replication and repair protein RecF